MVIRSKRDYYPNWRLIAVAGPVIGPLPLGVRTIRACRCIDQEPMIETIGSHLARRDSRKDRTQHHVTQNEVREILRNSSHFRFVEKGHRRGENVYSALGQTSAGRYLIVFFVRKKTGQALPISARDMTSGERKRYEKK
jgi:uncharacterized protein